MSTNDNVLEITNLSKRYGDFHLDVSFSLKSGTITGFVGQNGAGKSTTIKSIVGIVSPDSGSIVFKGEALDDKSAAAALDDIGYVSEDNDIYETIPLRHIHSFYRNLYSRWDEDFFSTYAQQIFRLDLDKKVGELSKGNKTRFFLLLALAHNPSLLVLDEPTASLDPVIRNELLELLYRLSRERNTTILFSSHITEDVEKIADDVIFIDAGSILYANSLDEIKSRFSKTEDGTGSELKPELDGSASLSEIYLSLRDKK